MCSRIEWQLTTGMRVRYLAWLLLCSVENARAKIVLTAPRIDMGVGIGIASLIQVIQDQKNQV